MLFKEVKQNFPIFLLDTSSVKLIKGKVTGATFPRLDIDPQQSSQQNSAYNPTAMPFSQNNTRMVVDLTIEADGHTATYTVSENASINYAGNLIIATEQSLLVPEVEAIKNAAERAIAPEHIDQLKQQYSKASALLAEINPVFKQQQEYDSRFKSIEGSVSELKEMMKSFIKEFKS